MREKRARREGRSEAEEYEAEVEGGEGREGGVKAEVGAEVEGRGRLAAEGEVPKELVAGADVDADPAEREEPGVEGTAEVGVIGASGRY